MISKTSLFFDLEQTQRALSDLLSRTTWGPTGQIALTRARDVPADVDPFHHGTGDWIDPKTRKMIFPESHFRFLDERLHGTYFEEIYKRVNEGVPEAVARMRIMQLMPRACYSYHADDEYRYHLAIESNPTAFVIFEDLPPQHIPMDGWLYGFEARKKHTAINCGMRPRVHIVITTYPRDENLS